MQKRAILSVSDKNGIADFAKGLINLGFEILSTGGTLAHLRENNISATDLGAYTGQNELFDGRVKTLHPKIHGGILYRRNDATHAQSAEQNDIYPIDLVCVNLYPFRETTNRTNDFDEIIENIDIGGPSLIRAAAKNYESVIIVVDSADYGRILEALRIEKEAKNPQESLEFRRNLMIKAFSHTAEYDSFIANYMNARFNGGFGESHFIVGKKFTATRYGENPHQRGALYEFRDAWSKNFSILKGEASFNNFLDINNALKIVSAFDKNAICIVKHGNPCGFAIKDDLVESYKCALSCDTLSAYGGVVAINGRLDALLAETMKEVFFEVIVAREVEQNALDIFSDKKRVRIFAINGDFWDTNSSVKPSSDMDFRRIQGGFLLQTQDFIDEREVLEAKQMGECKANDSQMQDLLIAHKIAAFTKSNGIAFVKDSVLLGIGMGLTSRVDAVNLAISKAQKMDLDLSGASVASEAFFPFRDSIDLLAPCEISAIIEPGGSIRDNEVIEAANEHKIALYFSGKRHFLH
ncbi:bifunctional phosphoribosylaminoimidazolecarboxamide formyltransferase/IMP cyclohydrolase [Helicobacter sp. 23-1045]